MIHSADVREWRNRDVVDTESHKIGVLEAVYVDTTTDEPAMATVRTGLPTRHRLLCRAGGSGLQALRTALQARCGRRTATGAPLITHGRDD
jgi:hypothetical protein